MGFFTEQDVVTALYRSVLGREPDPVGFAAYCNELDADHQALNRVASEFFASAEHRSSLGRVPAIPDHSQFGEFPLILRELVAAGARHRIVVDVGARGRERSNSFDLLSNFGWRGLLIEANPALQNDISVEFAGTNFTLLNFAVGVEDAMLPFYIGVNDDVSSLLPEHAAGWGPIKSSVLVEVRRLAVALQEQAIPHDFDLLSLDIEGMDIPVLNDLIETSDYRPPLILVEASFDYQTKSLADVAACGLVQRLYEITAQTKANLLLTLRK